MPHGAPRPHPHHADVGRPLESGGVTVLRFEWKALRIGDRVVVHDSLVTEFRLLAGTVAMVETTRPGREVNGVGIRVTDAVGSRVVWPSSLAVHHDPPDPHEDCWQCAALAEIAARQLESAVDVPVAAR